MMRDPELFEMVQCYIDGLFHCDTVKLNRAFHPNASLFDGEKGDVFAEPSDIFIHDIGELEPTSPANLGQDPDSEILLVDWLSNVSAVVKLRIRARKNVYLDHLGFVKGAEGWRIVSKIWHLETTVSEI
ncbi:MAG: nuclear transport factor 2 family protein [Paracoccaceae bacterium]